MKCSKQLCFFLLVLGLTSPTLIAKTDIKIAVASNFYYSLSELLKSYPHLDEVQFKLSSGATGMLYAQIKQGAPFDLFFSADNVRPMLLEQDQLTVLRQTYALGQLALWSNKPVATNKTDEQTYIQALQTHQERLAYANPKLAPFGLAAEQVLNSIGLNKDYVNNRRRILGNNVSQVFQFVNSNNVNLGFVPLSLLIQAQQQLKQDKYNHYWIIPSTQHQIIEQQLVLLKRSKRSNKHSTELQQFVDYILSSEVQKKLTTMGYKSPLNSTERAQ